MAVEIQHGRGWVIFDLLLDDESFCEPACGPKFQLSDADMQWTDVELPSKLALKVQKRPFVHSLSTFFLFKFSLQETMIPSFTAPISKEF